MERACLVTGKSGPLLVELAQRVAARERGLLVTRSGRLDPDLPEGDTVSVISWNRRSALSARSVVLHATNIFNRLDEAIVVFSPAHDTGTFHDTSIVSIEDRIDAEVKGSVYILREIFAQLVKQRSGRVVLVMQHPPEELQSPMEASGIGSFAMLAESLERYYRNEPISVLRFRSDEDDAPGFAEYILDRLDVEKGRSSRGSRNGGRWIRYPAGLKSLRRKISVR